MKERLKKSVNCFEFSFLEETIFYCSIILIKFYKSTPFGSNALLELRKDMMLAVSSLSLGYRNIVLSLLFER